MKRKKNNKYSQNEYIPSKEEKLKIKNYVEKLRKEHEKRESKF